MRLVYTIRYYTGVLFHIGIVTASRRQDYAYPDWISSSINRFTIAGMVSFNELGVYTCYIRGVRNYTDLVEYSYPTNVNIIASWSFKGCTGLVEADMQWADATEVREGAFKNCSALTEIILPSNIQVLGDSCFYGIGATSFTVPDTVTEVQAWCFARAYSLTEIVFEGDAPAIGEGAFNKITLTAYYPGDNATWTSDVMQNYGGIVSWKAG